jgi:hypothetical protein
MSNLLECKINICSDCGKEILLCDSCHKQFEIGDTIICLVIGFDRTKHFHN